MFPHHDWGMGGGGVPRMQWGKVPRPPAWPRVLQEYHKYIHNQTLDAYIYFLLLPLEIKFCTECVGNNASIG